MVIDTSALIAILLGEPEAKAFSEAIANAPKRLLSAFSALETSIVIESKKGEPGGRELDLLLSYALCKYSGEPLLFKGDDFSKTDVQSALPPTQQ